jgi:hypothetical protein
MGCTLSGILYIIAGFAALVAAAHSEPLEARKAEWLQLRGDRHMSGRAAGIGHMDGAPAAGWRFDIAAWESYFSVARPGSDHMLPLPFQTPINPAYIQERGVDWGIGAPLEDLYGSGTPLAVPVNNHAKVAKILTAVQGLQKFEMEDSFSDGGSAPKKGRLLAYDSAEPRTVWETESFDDVWAPNVIVVDANQDGQLDLAVATHYRILVFDGATGTTLMQLRYHNYRNYGFFAAANIDADPFPEFCVVADFSMHAEVIDNDGSNLELRWIRAIQPDPAQSTKIVRPNPRAFLDLEGDGSTEVVYSIYNDSGDKEWHIVAVDALSGETRYDFPQHFLNGIHDLDGDGTFELLVSETRGEALPPYAPLAVWTLEQAGAAPQVRWSHAGGSFSTRLLDRMALQVATGAADGRRTTVVGDADSDGSLNFFVAMPDLSTGFERLMAYTIDAQAGGAELWSVVGPPGAGLQAVAVAEVDGNRATLLHLKGRDAPDQGLEFFGGEGVLHQWSRQSFTPVGTPVVADLENDGRIEVVVQTGTQEVICIEAPTWSQSGQAPRGRWQLPGYGQTNNAPFHKGVSAADLDQDGKKEVLFAQEAPGGQASLVAVEPDGKIRWQTVFAEFDGSMPIWNFSGLSYWTAGNFISTAWSDVFVSLRKGKIGSEIGHLLDGRSGEILWAVNGFALPADGSPRSLGGHPAAAGDTDGDGLDEIVVMWPDRLHIVDGPSGQADVVRQTYGYTTGLDPIFSSATFIGYAYPAVVDLFGDATPELIWGHSGYLNAVLQANGERVWETPYQNNTQVQSLPGIGDLDGDGTMELVASTNSGLQVYNAEDGSILYTLTDAGIATTDMVSGDIDADGRDEFLFASGSQIVCIELQGDTLQEAWTLDAGATCSDLALADVDADLFLDLVVCTSDGYVKTYIGDSPNTLVAEDGAGASRPQTFVLGAPYPNPFNSAVVIPYQVRTAGRVQIDIFDLQGQRLRQLVDAQQAPGAYQINWDGTSAPTRPVSTGMYLIRLQAESATQIRKVVLLK